MNRQQHTDSDGRMLFSPIRLGPYDLQHGDADLVAFGRRLASNPDVLERFRHNHSLTRYNRDAFWGGDQRGYIDYRAFQKQAAD
jgi:2,4-dienoyl-CoA reductase-like NADH-dependent reductase (Old Yellow Enzyme family)